MQTARVLGTVNSTVKHDSLVGCKLLVVQPLLADGKSYDEFPLVAADFVGAGPGSLVVITSDSRFAGEMLKADRTPLRWTTIGVCDE